MSNKRAIYVETAWAVGVALLVLALTLLSTRPLTEYFSQGIPYQRYPLEGWELYPLVTGDHMQFYYWLWVLADNVFGPSAFWTNPYEFNTFLSAGVPNYANFPWSLAFLSFIGFGPVKAYNLQLILSYVLTGLAAYALARQMLGSRWAALPAVLAMTFLPLRQALALGGHLYGFVVFLFPLALWCLERGWARRSWRWGAGAGLCLLAMGFMEPHITYYSALFLGAYVPLRLVLMGGKRADAGDAGHGSQMLWPLAGGLGLGLAAHLALVLRTGAGLWSMGLVQGPVIYTLLALGAWLLLAALARAFFGLSQSSARGLISRTMAPLALTPLMGLKLWLGVPYLGSLVLVGVAAWSLVILVQGLRGVSRQWSWPKGALIPLWPMVVGFGLAVVKLMMLKAHTLDTSVAAHGRGIGEIMAFSPRLVDLVSPQNQTVAGLIYPGMVLGALFLAGLVMLAAPRGDNRGGRSQVALWCMAALLALLLAVGPSLTVAPLYELLFKYIPFFNFPRMTGRWVLIAVLFMSLVGGWALREILHRYSARRWLLGVAALATAALMAWDYGPPGPVGICLIPPPGQVEAAIAKEIPPGPQVSQRVLGLPIWPGDSHQSSRYEYTISRTSVPMVNGYSPVVPQAYVDEVFWPLYPLDLGQVTDEALACLRKLKVGLVTFHDDQQVYPRKVSPFPPSLARRRLEASGIFELAAQQDKVFLYRFKSDAVPNAQAQAKTSPVCSLWEAPWLRPRIGQVEEDRQASGWGLLFSGSLDPAAPLGERIKGAKGNVVAAKAGRDQAGWLSSGPGKYFPPGRYVARYRLQRAKSAAGLGSVGRMEIAFGKEPRVLVARELTAEVLSADGQWHDVAVEFSLDKVGPLFLRTHWNGAADLALDVVLVSFADRVKPEAFYRAQDLWRQVGGLSLDPPVEGGLAVEAKAGYTPPLYLMHGPQVTLTPGRYVARFRIAARGEDASPRALAAHLAVATDLGRITLAHRKVAASELGPDYRDLAVEFTVERRQEIGLRVRYLGGVSLRLAGVGLVRIDGK